MFYLELSISHLGFVARNIFFPRQKKYGWDVKHEACSQQSCQLGLIKHNIKSSALRRKIADLVDYYHIRARNHKKTVSIRSLSTEWPANSCIEHTQRLILEQQVAVEIIRQLLLT